MPNTLTPSEVKAVIKSVEDNSHMRQNDGAKQSIVQDVKNSSTAGGSNAFMQGHKGGKQ